jgi:hypothetical protein
MQNNYEQNLLISNIPGDSSKDLFIFSPKNTNYFMEFPKDDISSENNFFNELYRKDILQYEEIINEENNQLKENCNDIFKESKEPMPIQIYLPDQSKCKKIDVLELEELKTKEIEKCYKNKESKIEKRNKRNNNNNKFTNKNIFNVYSLFNPKEESEKFQLIRNEINDIILEYTKKEIKKDIFKSKSNSRKEYFEICQKRKSRKFKSDDIRKKIKARFLKSLKNRLNEKLTSEKSKYLFDFLPQCFICSITKKTNNNIILNMTLKELMSTDFFNLFNYDKKENRKTMLNKKREDADAKKYNKNLKVLEYLEQNKEISQRSNFDVIGKMTFKDLFNEYLKSKEFEEDILRLKKENNEDLYIKDYIIKAFNFVNYFSK